MYSDGRLEKKLYFHCFFSLITSSWQTPTVIRYESVTSATRCRSHPTRLNTANMAHQNLFHQKLSIRLLCQKLRTSGTVSFEFIVNVFLIHTHLFLILFFILPGQLESSHICGGYIVCVDPFRTSQRLVIKCTGLFLSLV